MPLLPCANLRRRLSVLFAAAALVVGSAAALDVSQATLVATTSTAGTLTAGTLSGANAPATGTASFTATPISLSQCSVSWSALIGGAAVADNVHLALPSAGFDLDTGAHTLGIIQYAP